MPVIFETDRDDSKFFVFARAPAWTVLCFIYAMATYPFFPMMPPLMIGGILLVGVAACGLVLLSIRYYSYWFSWLLWALPIPALLAALVAQPLHEGSLPTLQVLFQVPGFAGAAMFGLLWTFRDRMVKWVR